MAFKVALACVVLSTLTRKTHTANDVVSIAFVLTAPQRAESKAY